MIEGYTPKSRDDAMASFNNVSDRYFETLGTSIVGGPRFQQPRHVHFAEGGHHQ